MQEKITLYASGNEEGFNYYIFDKKQEVAKKISQLFQEFFNVKINLFEAEGNKEVNIEKKVDFHEIVSSAPPKKGESRIDIFYGNKKMFVTINCSNEKRLKFNEKLLEIAEFPEGKQ